MSYQLVEELQKKACPKVAVSQACRVVEVSRSGYYVRIPVNVTVDSGNMTGIPVNVTNE